MKKVVLEDMYGSIVCELKKTPLGFYTIPEQHDLLLDVGDVFQVEEVEVKDN